MCETKPLLLTVRFLRLLGMLQDKRVEMDKHGLNIGDYNRAVGKGPGPRPQAPKDAPVERSPFFDKVRRGRRAVRSAVQLLRASGAWCRVAAGATVSCRASASLSCVSVECRDRFPVFLLIP